MNWIYCEDQLPKYDAKASNVYFASVKMDDGRTYASICIYHGKGKWTNLDLRSITVYAWSYTLPAPER
jgi:hypothetical protein